MTVRQLVLGIFRLGLAPPRMVQTTVDVPVAIGNEYMGSDVRFTHILPKDMIPQKVTIKRFSLRAPEGERPRAMSLTFAYTEEHGHCRRIQYDKANGVTIVYTLRPIHKRIERRIAEVKVDLDETYEDSINDRLMKTIERFASDDCNMRHIHLPVKKAICLALEQR